MPKTLDCPQCGEAAAMSAQNPWRPFCSKRCRDRDLLKWLDDGYALPGPPSFDDNPQED